MNTIDATCKQCKKPIRWLSGTRRLCSQCASQPISSTTSSQLPDLVCPICMVAETDAANNPQPQTMRPNMTGFWGDKKYVCPTCGHIMIDVAGGETETTAENNYNQEEDNE